MIFALLIIVTIGVQKQYLYKSIKFFITTYVKISKLNYLIQKEISLYHADLKLWKHKITYHNQKIFIMKLKIFISLIGNNLNLFRN